jgi:hypothetical protein
MLSDREIFNRWNLEVFARNRHQEFTDLLRSPWFGDGIYLIACDQEIVYIGQSHILQQRSIQSLGRVYHRVPDTSLQWGIAYAPCAYKDMDEQESTAIRAFAPRFNTSIPSVAKSQGKMPEIVATATVFQTPDSPCAAFHPDNMRQQMDRAAVDPDPPWRRKKPRRKPERSFTRKSVAAQPPLALSDEERLDLIGRYGVPANGPLVYPVNLCDDGMVLTRDGEILGSWSLDDDANPFFIPEGHEEPLFGHLMPGGLALRIREWHEDVDQDFSS